MLHPCMPQPTPAKKVEKVSLPAVKDPPELIYIREVPVKDDNKETKETLTLTNYKIKWWHVALAFVLGYSLASSNSSNSK
ncbi:hypothetical protein [uncultured Capnocytophaga sp.]|uniref:hypothetical protein n=1 Tax=uncultured Capnocytophaga sp. TaxID=159273 RepID=UPI0028EEDA45|nr:hypothetical protein [uncultured Capnocytophaga sp.]